MSDKQIVVYWGCFTPTKQYALELSTRSVFKALGVDIVELKDSACCGYPYRGVKPKLWIFLAARILALAEKQGYENVLAVCNGCYNSLLKAEHYLKEDKNLLSEVNSLLAEEGLEYRGKAKPLHVIEFLHRDFGLGELRKLAFSEKRRELKVAAHYGCDAIRPGEIPRFDDPRNPRKFEDIIEALGFTAVRDYPRRLDCCGAPLLSVNPELGFKVSGLKLKYAGLSGADLLVTTCEYCFEMLDTKQELASKMIGEELSVPVMYYQQLLGLCLGLSERELGLNFNMSPIDTFLEEFER
ncbi:MAG: hypothetical protein DRJ52_09330 [Thermoprotei archaeon]|nr:MAG: hypothetical protein DRJ52_09330 [Thermoprotei archaeon]